LHGYDDDVSPQRLRIVGLGIFSVHIPSVGENPVVGMSFRCPLRGAGTQTEN
jgi:hypothetical protein